MSDAPPFALAAGFAAPDSADWEQLALKALKGAPLERLTRTTPDGIAYKPLYTAADVEALPPAFPARSASRDPWLAWDIRQAFGRPDAATTNAEILTDLQRGVSSLELLVAGRTRPGLSLDGIGRALDGVLLDLAPVALNAGGSGLAAAQALAQVYQERGASPDAARPVFNLDPVSAWLMEGALAAPAEEALAQAAAFAAGPAAAWPLAKVMRASGRTVHEAGASPAEELAVMLASAVMQLRALEAAGLAPEAAAGRIVLALAVDADVVPGIAKLRAARLLWARMLEACGAAPESRVAQIQAITSRRMMTRNDAWTNILRVTAGTFAAATGGADVITALPLTAALGEASAQARRIARNTQIILMEESHLGRVADPGGGAYAIEALTHDLAEAAWARFAAIEAQGGLVAAVRSGAVQAMVAKSRAALEADVARRRLPITGVSNQPLPGEAPPPFDPLDEPAPGAAAPAAPAADPVEPLAWFRLAEPFEELRARGEAARSPPVFFANLGPLAEFTARAGFARNLLSVGGLATPASESAYPDLPALVEAFRASGARAAVLCGTDARYTDEAGAAASALRAAGASAVILAGKPAEEAALRTAGVSHFIFAGQDALAALADIHSALGI
jgi:methylmalonyl-CoA mutase